MNDIYTHKEIFARYGAASYRSIAFEQELIIMCLAVARVADPGISAAELAQLDEDLSDATLGRLLRRVKGELRVPEDVDSLFGEALKTRNDLVHRFWYWSSGLELTDSAYTRLLEWLRAATTLFRRAEHEARQIADAVAAENRLPMEQVTRDVLDLFGRSQPFH